jgi:hypothetical protein
MNEDELKAVVRSVLGSDFLMKEEVDGLHLLTGEQVKIDFLLYPKDHLIASGFERIWVGIEVKSPNVKEPVKNGLKLAWQAITYTQSEFGDIRPAFVLVYPHLKEFFPLLTAINTQNDCKYNHSDAHLLTCFVQKGNVGYLETSRDGAWKIAFGASALYYSSKRGKGLVKNLGQTKLVGTSKRKNLTRALDADRG